jgi:hypothetical protein
MRQNFIINYKPPPPRTQVCVSRLRLLYTQYSVVTSGGAIQCITHKVWTRGEFRLGVLREGQGVKCETS